MTDSPFNRYGDIAAEIYDLDKPYGALPDTAFYLARFEGFAGRILEPACGSGRTLVPLLRAGCAVSGFDPSPEMLTRCRARCAAEGFAPDLSDQTFETFGYSSRFDAVVAPVGSFTLIDAFERSMAVLRRFRDHLAPGGLLVLDIQPLLFLANASDDQRQWSAENGELLTLHGRRVSTDWMAQRAESLLRYERWRDGRLIETQLERMAQRFWGLEEFALALAAAGFGSIGVTGGYDRTRAAKPGDRVLTFEARRID
jgi:SAM-dependent methyltransferase